MALKIKYTQAGMYIYLWEILKELEKEKKRSGPIERRVNPARSSGENDRDLIDHVSPELPLLCQVPPLPPNLHLNND